MFAFEERAPHGLHTHVGLKIEVEFILDREKTKTLYRAYNEILIY